MTTSPWPYGQRSAATFTFDLDAEEVWEVDERAMDRPGVASQGTYGPKVALPAILALLDRYAVTATFFVPGRVAERHPDAVRSIAAGGHEVGHHGYTHRAPADLSAAEEATELIRGLETLRALDVEPRGYRAPSWDVSTRTLDLVAAAGMSYTSNLMDDLRPYVHEPTSVVELPVHWMLDDAPHFWFSPESWTRTIRSSAEVRTLWQEESQGIAAWGGLATWTFHPQMIGRPSRLVLLDELVSAAVSDPSVWVAPAHEVAGYVSENADHFARYGAGPPSDIRGGHLHGR